MCGRGAVAELAETVDDMRPADTVSKAWTSTAVTLPLLLLACQVIGNQYKIHSVGMRQEL